MNLFKRLFGYRQQPALAPKVTLSIDALGSRSSKASTPYPDHELWSGPIVSTTDDAVKDPPEISMKDNMMNAAANVMGYDSNGHIRFLVRSGTIVGVWVKSFPDNVTKRAFLSFYCTWKQKMPGGDAGSLAGLEKAHNSASVGLFEIFRVRNGEGFNVRFL